MIYRNSLNEKQVINDYFQVIVERKRRILKNISVFFNTIKVSRVQNNNGLLLSGVSTETLVKLYPFVFHKQMSYRYGMTWEWVNLYVFG